MFTVFTTKENIIILEELLFKIPLANFLVLGVVYLKAWFEDSGSLVFSNFQVVFILFQVVFKSVCTYFILLSR